MLIIILLIFGTKKLRNLGSDLGGAVKGFKDGMRDATAEDKPAEGGTPPAPPAQVNAGQTTKVYLELEELDGTDDGLTPQVDEVEPPLAPPARSARAASIRSDPVR